MAASCSGRSSASWICPWSAGPSPSTPRTRESRSGCASTTGGVWCATTTPPTWRGWPPPEFPHPRRRQAGGAILAFLQCLDTLAALSGAAGGGPAPDQASASAAVVPRGGQRDMRMSKSGRRLGGAVLAAMVVGGLLALFPAGVNAAPGDISLFAGPSAITTAPFRPAAVSFAGTRVYFTDTANHQVDFFDTGAPGSVTVAAGTGTPGAGADGVAGSSSALN